MTTEVKRGSALFTGSANCASGHTGRNFTDDKFHDIGLATPGPGPHDDHQRGRRPARLLKTPGLREIAARALFMHHGQPPTLEAVIGRYNMRGQKRPLINQPGGPPA
jgi:cytochrome c peroxidase